jgi:uncharacterized repeat protein (TIGR03803 family)
MKSPPFFFKKICLGFLSALVLVALAHAAGYKRVHNFGSGLDGSNPSGPLAFDAALNSYGTTAAGGAFGFGTVFMIAPSGEEQILWNFTGGSDGAYPYGGVVVDLAGNLYGTTVAGGSGFCAGDGCGVVFELTNSGDSWDLVPIYSFTGGNDGFGPGSTLQWDGRGNFYGTTPDGGEYGYGVIYEISQSNDGWRFRTLHAFTGNKDGAVGSLGALAGDYFGNLYGTTELGGDFGAGTVYQLSPIGEGASRSWKFTTLYQFQGMPDAANPYGGLALDEAENLYGTTYFGGQFGMGTVFQLARGSNGAWQENVLYDFQGGTDGSFPTSTLLFSEDPDSFYGTTTTGGRPSCDCGTAFSLKLAHGHWQEKIVHDFGRGRDGSYPSYGFSTALGVFWGTTPAGGTDGGGTLFHLAQ